MISLWFKSIKLSGVHIIRVIANSDNYLSFENFFKVWSLESGSIPASFGTVIPLVIDIVVVNTG